MGAQQISPVVIYGHYAEKLTYVPDMRDDDMITRKVYADKINFVLERMEAIRPVV